MDHIEHVVSVGGIDHVGLGPDFVHEVLTDVTPPCCEDLSYGESIPWPSCRDSKDHAACPWSPRPWSNGAFPTRHRQDHWWERAPVVSSAELGRPR